MMLTKLDLSQIRKVVREEVETEVKDTTQTLRSEIRESRMRVQSDIRDLDDRMKNVEVRMDGHEKSSSLVIEALDKIEGRLSGLEKDAKDIKKRVRKTEKTVDVMIDQFDKEIVGTQKRVSRIEEHLQL